MTRVRTHTNPFTVRQRFDLLKMSDIQSQYPEGVDLEIGFGRGVFLRQWAQRYPKRMILGVEVRKPLVKILEERLANANCDNAQLYYGNGVIFLEDAIEDGVLDQVFIFHPDPWFKKRHHKRRVVTSEFVTLLKAKLKPGGVVHISTDVDSLFQDMCKAFQQSSQFVFRDKDPFWDDYTSHWDAFSERENRGRWVGTFQSSLQC